MTKSGDASIQSSLTRATLNDDLTTLVEVTPVARNQAEVHAFMLVEQLESVMSKLSTSSDPTSDICPYDVDLFAEKYGLTKRAAAVILHSNGPSRQTCDNAAIAFVQALKMRELRGKSRELRGKPPASSIRA